MSSKTLSVAVFFKPKLNWKCGASHQLQILTDGLRSRGHRVSTFTDPAADLSGHDVAFVTSLNEPFSSSLADRCKARGVPLVIKAVHHPLFGVSVPLLKMMDDAAFITVESQAETDALLSCLSPYWAKGKYIPKIVEMKPAVHPDIYPMNLPRDGVHLNGRYDRNKGHLRVLRACKELEVRVSVAGHPQYVDVYNECLREGYGEVLGELSKDELRLQYNRAKVYVCASGVEVSSTSVCEAIACGCVVVSSPTHLMNSSFTKPGYIVYASEDTLKDSIKQALKVKKQENGYWTDTMLVNAYEELFLSLAR